MKIFLFALLLMGIVCPAHSADENYSEEQECRFTAVPNAVCSISFYRLIAVPEKFDNKYVSIVGYVGSDSGRLAVFPTKESYLLRNSQESISISSDLNKRIELFNEYGSHTVRIVGKFIYVIKGDEPGIGQIRDVSNIFKVHPRKHSAEDQVVTGTAEELSKLSEP